MLKNAFYFTLKALFAPRHLSFCLDFLVMNKNSSIRKIRFILKFMMSQPGQQYLKKSRQSDNELSSVNRI